jgi:hypothetical protein
VQNNIAPESSLSLGLVFQTKFAGKLRGSFGTGPPQWVKRSPLQARKKRGYVCISVNMAPRNKLQKITFA